MKKLLKIFFIETISLWFINNYFQGLIFDNGIKTFLITAFSLSIASIVVKPIVNILLLPLNLITFGLFKWLSSAVVLYLITLIIKDFHIEKFAFTGFVSNWIDLPSFSFEGWLAIIVFSFIISISASILSWIVK